MRALQPTGPTRRGVLAGGAAIPLAACAQDMARRSGSERSLVDDFDARVSAITAAIQAPRIPDRAVGIEGLTEGGDLRAPLQAALDAAAAAGGGRVAVPPGRWDCGGPIRLRSACVLHLSEGARVVFTGDPSAYLPMVLTRWEGTEAYNYSPMVHGQGLTDVAITGPGTLDGQGEANFLPWRDRQGPDQRALRRMGRDGVPVEARRFGPGHHLRPAFVELMGCERVLIEDVTLTDSPFWVVHPIYCRSVTVRGVTVVSRHLNSDGVDPDSCEDVLVERCTFDTGDDGVAVKSGRDQDGWRVGRPSRRIVVRDCRYAGTAGGGVAIGSEMSGGVEDVYVDGYEMGTVSHAVYLKANGDRGGYVRGVHARNLRIGRADEVLVITNQYKDRVAGPHPAAFSDVTLTDVRCGQADAIVTINGAPETPVRGVTLRDVTVGAADVPLRARGVRGLRFEDVTADGQAVAAVEDTGAQSFEGTKHY